MEANQVDVDVYFLVEQKCLLSSTCLADTLKLLILLKIVFSSEPTRNTEYRLVVQLDLKSMIFYAREQPVKHV
jgi:hypothetical protein